MALRPNGSPAQHVDPDDTRVRTTVGAVPGPARRDEGPESARFFELANDQVYTVTHAALAPRRGAVLLCGPSGVERERAYLTLVQWARSLAAHGYEVLRFDYRGQGESTGRFEDMVFTRWREDAEFCERRLRAVAQGTPLVLQGVRMGALVAAELFASGVGDGLLLWAPPASAEALLNDSLRHNLFEQRLAGPGTPHRLREQLLADLEAGELIHVDGYSWTRAMWREARAHPLRLPQSGERRPWRSLQTQAGTQLATEPEAGSGHAVVDADSFWHSRSSLLVPRSDGFFQASLHWLDTCEPWGAGAT